MLLRHALTRRPSPTIRGGRPLRAVRDTCGRPRRRRGARGGRGALAGSGRSPPRPCLSPGPPAGRAALAPSGRCLRESAPSACEPLRRNRRPACTGRVVAGLARAPLVALPLRFKELGDVDDGLRNAWDVEGVARPIGRDPLVIEACQLIKLDLLE